MEISEFLKEQFANDDQTCILYLRWYFATLQAKKSSPSIETITSPETVEQFMVTIVNLFKRDTGSAISPLSYFKWLKSKYGTNFKRRINHQTFVVMDKEYKQFSASRFDAATKDHYEKYIIEKFGELDVFEFLSEVNLKAFDEERRAGQMPVQGGVDMDVASEIDNFGSNFFSDMGMPVEQTERSNADSVLKNGAGSGEEKETLFGSLNDFSISGNVEEAGIRPPMPSEYDDVENPNTKPAIAKWREQGNLLTKKGTCFFCDHSFDIEITRKSRDYSSLRTIFGHSIFDILPVTVGTGKTEISAHLDLNLRPAGICPRCLCTIPTVNDWLVSGNNESSELPSYLMPEALEISMDDLKQEMNNKKVDRDVHFGNVLPGANANEFTSEAVRTIIGVSKALVETQDALFLVSSPRFKRVATGNSIKSLFQKVYIDLKYRNLVVEDDWQRIRDKCIDYVADDVDATVGRIKDDFRAKESSLGSNPTIQERHELKLKQAVDTEKRTYVLNMYRVVVIDLLENRTTRETERYRESILMGRGGVKAPPEIQQLTKAITEERDLIRQYYLEEPRKLIDGTEMKWLFNL